MTVSDVDVDPLKEVSDLLGLDEKYLLARNNFEIGARKRGYPVTKKSVRFLLDKYGAMVLNSLISEQIEAKNANYPDTDIQVRFVGFGHLYQIEHGIGIFLSSSIVA